MNARERSAFRRRLLGWYRANRRDLPWRRRPTLYRTLVAEFMLQQTRVDQALPYYRRFLRAFGSLRRLARATPAQVLKCWEGLGYYRRAGYLHAAARRLAARRSPGLQDLRACAGIGPYTLAAVASVVWNEPLPVVDGNVRRVAARLLALAAPPRSAEGRAAVDQAVSRWLDRRRAGEWNQALMELGASVCRPGKPLCRRCPVRSFCAGHRSGTPEAFPRRLPAAPRPHRHIAAAIIRRADGRILIAQRPADGLLPGLWEFPGGKQERGESLTRCCAREIQEELGIAIAVGPQVARIRHGYTHYAITLHVFECRHIRGTPRALGCQAWKWVRTSELDRYPFPRANWPIVASVRSGSRRSAG